MYMPEDNASVVLATIHAQAVRCLGAYRDEFARTTDTAVAAQITATIEPLTRAAADLALALARSVGYGMPTPPAPGKKAGK